jgi:hypothetical protein
MEYLIEMRVNRGVRVQTHNSCSDTMLNHQLSQKFKLIGNNKFNNLINTFNALELLAQRSS